MLNRYKGQLMKDINPVTCNKIADINKQDGHLIVIIMEERQ
jgi:hypothetical protein